MKLLLGCDNHVDDSSKVLIHGVMKSAEVLNLTFNFFLPFEQTLRFSWESRGGSLPCVCGQVEENSIAMAPWTSVSM